MFNFLIDMFKLGFLEEEEDADGDELVGLFYCYISMTLVWDFAPCLITMPDLAT